MLCPSCRNRRSQSGPKWGIEKEDVWKLLLPDKHGTCEDYARNNPHYSVAPERCEIQHEWFLRSWCPDVNRYGKENPGRKGRNHEYECYMCGVAAIYSAEAREFLVHPLCLEDSHYWRSACLDGCCRWCYCSCGACKPCYEGQKEGDPGVREDIRFTHDFYGNPLPATEAT